MNKKLQYAALVAALTFGASAQAQDLRFFLAENGLTNPADVLSDAVDPARTNPVAAVNDTFPKRLYIWAEHQSDGPICYGMSMNVQTTGTAEVVGMEIYSHPTPSFVWESILPAAIMPDGSAFNASAVRIIQAPLGIGGLYSGPGQATNPHIINDVQLVGHVEFEGVGDVFLEVGPNGITLSTEMALPGPDVALGYGDATITGSDYNTGTATAHASLRCVGDLNGDLTVDTADLGTLISEFGTPGVLADINNDGVVDTADLGALIAQFGSVCTDMLEK